MKNVIGVEDALTKHLALVNRQTLGLDVEILDQSSPKRWQIAIALVAVALVFWWLAPTIPFYP